MYARQKTEQTFEFCLSGLKRPEQSTVAPFKGQGLPPSPSHLEEEEEEFKKFIRTLSSDNPRFSVRERCMRQIGSLRHTVCTRSFVKGSGGQGRTTDRNVLTCML